MSYAPATKDSLLTATLLTAQLELIVITSAKEVMFCRFLFVCLFVCLSVSQQDTSKSYGKIFLKFLENVGNGISYKWFNFGGDPEGILDSGSL